VADNRMASSRGQYLDFNSQILSRIRDDQNITIYAFKAVESDVFVEGMRSKTSVWFELRSSCVTINLSRFELRTEAIPQADAIFYDLVRQVYRSVVKEQKWIDILPANQLRLALEFGAEEMDIQ